jgi:PAS domain S-box-containing protein
MFSGWQGGWGPGLLCMALSSLVANYFFLEPRYALAFGSKAIFSSVIFLVTSTLITWLNVQARENRIRAEHQRLELEATERRLAAITHNATLGLFLMNAQQHCVFMNPAAEKITGFTLAELQGRPLHDFIHHTRPDGTPYPMAECPIDRALPTRAQEQGEDVFVRKDGSFYPVAFTASPIVENGVAIGTVIELRDTTQEKHHQAERERLLTELQEAVSLRDEFLSVASHELKTPLTPLTLRLQRFDKALAAVPRSELTERMEHDMAVMHHQLRRLTDLVDELLDVSRIRLGHMQLHLEPVDLAELTREVVTRFEPEAEKARCTLELQVEGPVIGHWDRSRLEQVVTNLLSNAFKYGAGKPLHIRTGAVQGRAQLVVRDEGIGIAPEALERIFHRFERAVSERNYGGLGLGLYVTRQIVQALGGTIQAESTPGQGATFTVELPLDASR